MSSYLIIVIAGICYSGGLYLLIKKMLREEAEILEKEDNHQM
jgi:hypothetical protein